MSLNAINGVLHRRPQSGAAMIVVLVILTSVTLLSSTAVSNQNINYKLAQNEQFQAGTYLAAYSEINKELDTLNTNTVEEDDALILELLESEVEKPISGISPATARAKKRSDKTPVIFNTEVEYMLACDPASCPIPPGYSQSDNTKVLRAWIRSSAKLANDPSNTSSQSQAFWYLLPQGNIVTF